MIDQSIVDNGVLLRRICYELQRDARVEIFSKLIGHLISISQLTNDAVFLVPHWANMLYKMQECADTILIKMTE